MNYCQLVFDLSDSPVCTDAMSDKMEVFKHR